MVKVREQRDIEHLVIWALRDQGLGWAGKERVRDDFSDLGTVIDQRGAVANPSISLWSDDDAMLVKKAIDQLPAKAGAMVMQYGRAGLRPDWCEEGYGSYQQLKDGRGRLLWEWSDPIHRRGKRTPRKAFVGEQRETVDFHRTQYLVWWQGIADIVAPLNQVLESYQATGPAAPQAPWSLEKPTVFDADGNPIVSAVPQKVSAISLDERRALAQSDHRSKASDWDFPQRS